MAQILTKKQLSLEAVGHFYARRIHRIVPSYILVFFGTVVTTGMLMMDSDNESLPTDTLWALTFTSNLEDISKESNYFDKVFV